MKNVEDDEEVAGCATACVGGGIECAVLVQFPMPHPGAGCDDSQPKIDTVESNKLLISIFLIFPCHTHSNPLSDNPRSVKGFFTIPSR